MMALGHDPALRPAPRSATLPAEIVELGAVPGPWEKGKTMRFVAAVLLLAGLWAQDASAAVLDRIRDSGVLKIGYREDAAPFSYKNDIGEPGEDTGLR